MNAKDGVDTSTSDRFDWMYLEDNTKCSDGSVQLNYVIKPESPS